MSDRIEVYVNGVKLLDTGATFTLPPAPTPVQPTPAQPVPPQGVASGGPQLEPGHSQHFPAPGGPCWFQHAGGMYQLQVGGGYNGVDLQVYNGAGVMVARGTNGIQGTLPAGYYSVQVTVSDACDVGYRPG